MKTVFTILLFLFFFCNNAVAQDYRFHLGLDAYPIALLSGNVAFTGLLQLPKRFSVKPVVGFTSNVDNNFHTTCLLEDNFESRITRGTYAKLVVDYNFIDVGSYKLHAGGGLIYTSFERSGFHRHSGLQEKRSGQIFAAGIDAGVRKKFFGFVVFDLGGQLFIHRGNRFDIGPPCLNFIPGFSPLPYFQVLIDLKKLKG
jgi:hypothetical protein